MESCCNLSVILINGRKMTRKYTRREFLKTSGLGTAALSLACATGANLSGKIPNQKNVVLIFADDVSPDLYGCYGNKLVKTPNIDMMAEKGVKFRTAWATALCAPSRALIMTGRYGFRTGFYHNDLQIGQADGSRNLLKYHHSFGKLLKDAGYATAIAGKWHLGSGTPHDKNGGFEEYCLWEGLGSIRELDGSPDYDGGFENDVTTSRYWHPGIVKNGKLVKTKSYEFGPDIFTDFLCDFIERKKDQPFLAYFPMVSPHGTRQGVTTTPDRGEVGEMRKSSDRNENAARFRALNEYIDKLVGRLIKKITDLKLLENTVIIFTSDNGTGSTAKSRGVERGCRVPYVVYGGGTKQRGDTDELTDLSDILPTLVDYAESHVPKGYEVDGKSLKPFLTGRTNIHREWIHSYIGTTQLLRTRDYLLEAVNPMMGLPEGRFLYCGSNRDGKEYRNITGSGDPKHQAERKKFNSILKSLKPLTLDHPHFKTKKGKRFVKNYTVKNTMKKHLHNHEDFKYYDE